MEGKLAMTRHFFKKLPPAFCRKLKQEKSEWAVVKSRKGTWKINLCRNCEGLTCFKDGWPSFVQNHGLSIGDFVLFEHIGGLHFNAFIFEWTACEKEFVVEMKEEQEEAPEAFNVNNHQAKNTTRGGAMESDLSYHSQNPYFVLTMKPYHAQRNAQVRSSWKKEWPVKLSFQKAGQFRCKMLRGWHGFYVTNQFKDGDACVFDLNRHSLQCTTALMDVQIFPAPV